MLDLSRPVGALTRKPPDYSDRIILDLCGGTGAWSRPYREAGYDVRVVTLPNHDVRTYEPPGERVWGILAAPPCTMFSKARTTAATPRDLRYAMETVAACLYIIWQCQYDGQWLSWWALENPDGLLRMYLGNPAYTFTPADYGHPSGKRTDLWGKFTPPKPPGLVLPVEYVRNDYWRHEQVPEGYVRPPDMADSRQVRRAITPAVFAEAFYKANP